MTEQNTQQTTAKPEQSQSGGVGTAAMDREELRRLYEESCANIKEGAIVKGRVMKVDKDDVYVDIGYKSEGIVHISEFEDFDEVTPGQEIDVLLESKEDPDGMVVLSRIKAERQKKWDETILRSKEGDMARGKIMRKVRGGVIVDIGMDAFLPASQIDIRHVGNIDDYIGRVFDFKIIKINTERKNVVLSRRELLEEERARNRERLLAEIEVGQTREGVVKNITDFGAFIDLHGMDGLLHITDMTWGRINHPSEMLSIGEKVEVMILDFDRERQRIALGLKQKAANPWQDIETKYPVGSIVKGRIVNIVPYGAFIEIERGVEGLIHISEMSWTKRINHPSEIISVGDEVEAMVLNIKKDEAKISLGIKQTEFNPWSVVEEKYPPSTRIRGRVRNITSYGAFVELEEGIDGLIHISDMSWTRKINHPTEVLKKGELTEAVVLAVDQEAKKITLGLKQLEANPWETIDDFIRLGSVVEAEVTKIADFGVFATLENGIECLIHISQLSEKPFQKIEDIVSKGDRVLAKVDRIDKQRRKIALSIKEYQREVRVAEEKAAMEAAKAISFGEEPIVGMKEHIEQAVEQLVPRTPPAEMPEAGEPPEAGERAEEAPASAEERFIEPGVAETAPVSETDRHLEPEETVFDELPVGEPGYAEVMQSPPAEEEEGVGKPVGEAPVPLEAEPTEAPEAPEPVEGLPLFAFKPQLVAPHVSPPVDEPLEATELVGEEPTTAEPEPPSIMEAETPQRIPVEPPVPEAESSEKPQPAVAPEQAAGEEPIPETSVAEPEAPDAASPEPSAEDDLFAAPREPAPPPGLPVSDEKGIESSPEDEEKREGSEGEAAP
jgi:small subunit ribosomal protein S1